MNQFFAQSSARDPKPASSFGLVALSRSDSQRKQLTFHVFENPATHVLNLACCAFRNRSVT